ncbi:hypothetical protein [Rheinheimera mangrovi]|uniref:hypothetical protein n=1 Tax=Rheinheimera mangrovi TaxID=2498451 RepID=UPI000F8D531D|nr:hypothetical protein [Rheinheimera mangrovi]
MSYVRTFETNFSHFKNAVSSAIIKLDSKAIVTMPTRWIVDEAVSNNNSKLIRPSEPFTLTAISQKGNAGSKRICAYIDGYLRISGKTSDRRVRIDKYCTEVLYCYPCSSIDYKNLKVSSGFHFDFDVDVQPAHPIFHMQHDNTILREKVEKKVTSLQPQLGENRLFRVPTSQMDILSALVMLIADHFVDKSSRQEYETFVSLLDSIDKYMVLADFSLCKQPFRGPLSTYGNLNSISWYCHP